MRTAAMVSLPFVSLLLSVSLTTAIVIPGVPNADVDNTSSAVTRSLVSRATDDPADFSWVKRWAAIGDSFTAGIGSGEQTGDFLTNAWKCSRYTYSWPQIVNKGLGPSVTDFQYPACSGDRTEGIRQQAAALKGDLDLVMMTAGGNDLCLAAIIKECIFLPWGGEEACQEVLDKAQENIDTILKPNIQTILEELDTKMADDGILVYNGYAPYFDTTNEDCGDKTKQNWPIRSWWSRDYWEHDPLPLNIARREKFNSLVAKINVAIKEVVAENDGKKPYRIAFGDWSDWPAQVDGQMCSPSSDGRYPDPAQEGMLFIKPDTAIRIDKVELRKRNETEWEVAEREAASAQQRKRRELQESYAQEMKKRNPNKNNMYNSLIFKSANPQAVALHKLNPRSAAPPKCPGDGNVATEILGMGMPDSFLSNFHPNEKGHEAIAAVALDTMTWMRAKVLDVESKVCPINRPDQFLCNGRPKSGEKDKGHVTWKQLDITHKEFCANQTFPTTESSWKRAKFYHEDTPEEHWLRVTVKTTDGTAQGLDRDFCRESFDHLINRCDGNDPENPLNFKFGGKYVRGDVTFEISPMWARGLVVRHEGECNSHYKVVWSQYDIVGSGWALHDRGKGSLDAMWECMGVPNYWDFVYCRDRKDCHGFDWKWTLGTPALVKARCFDNLKVQKALGGYTHKYKKAYKDFGCAGSDR